MSANRIIAAKRIEIANDYLSGLPVSQVAAKHKCSLGTVTRVLAENNIVARWQAATSEQCDAMIADYLTGTSAKAAAAKFGWSEIVCLGALQRAGIVRRACTDFIQSNKALGKYSVGQRKYELDERFFEAIETEEQAYWLGFIAADGCVSNNNLIVTLSMKDIQHLHKLASSLKSTMPIKLKDNTGYLTSGQCATLRVTSALMVKHLYQHGILPRKSLTLQAWPGPENLMRHYWRGVVDGDGWVSVYRNNTQVIGLTGSKSMMEAFSSFVRKLCAARATIHTNGSACWRVMISRKGDVKIIARALYGDASIALDRKLSVAQQIISE